MSGPLGVRVAGPLERYAAGFGAELQERGYAPASVQRQLQLMAHLSRWLDGRGLGGSDLSAWAVEEFLGARRGAGYSCLCSHRALAPLLGYLRGTGAAPAPLPPEVGRPEERLLEDYRGYLVRERGLAAGSAGLYARVARVFLLERPDPVGPSLGRLAAGDVTGYVLHACQSSPPGAASMKTLVTALRSLLRYLYLEGWVRPS